HAEIDGANVTGSLAVPNTAAWQTWTTLTRSGIALPQGQHVLRIAMDANGSSGSVGNFNYLTIKPDAAPPPASLTVQAEDFDAGGVTGQLTIPTTGGWQNWTTISKSGVTVSAGTHVLKLRMDAAGTTGSVGNFNWLKLTKTA